MSNIARQNLWEVFKINRTNKTQQDLWDLQDANADIERVETSKCSSQPDETHLSQEGVAGQHGHPCGGAWIWQVWYGMVWYGMVWYGMVWYSNTFARIITTTKYFVGAPTYQEPQWGKGSFKSF